MRQAWETEPEDGFEDLDEYIKGGFCPIQLADKLDNGALTIVYKLGFGSFSTVWLARDERFGSDPKQHPLQYVALKMITANHPEARPGFTNEGTIQKALRTRQTTTTTPSSILCELSGCGILPVLRTFTHLSFNGLHQVLVMPVVRPITELSYSATQYLEIARQSICAIRFLHQNGIVHGDLHTGNVAYRCDNIADTFRRFPRPQLNPVLLWNTGLSLSRFYPPLTTRAGNFNVLKSFSDQAELSTRRRCLPQASKLPAYTISAEEWQVIDHFFANSQSTAQACLLDFGSAFSIYCPSNCLPAVTTPVGYMAPEYVFPLHTLPQAVAARDLSSRPPTGSKRRHGDASAVLGSGLEKADVWSLGCLLYELVGCGCIYQGVYGGEGHQREL